MILADKIIHHRKLLDLTQEDLAEKLNVSRQSVSKWEGALSIPDLNKIIAMSEIFGVSIDYLLKDEIGTHEPIQEDSTKRLSLEVVNSFLDKNMRASKLISTGVSLCILAPTVLIFLTTRENVLSSDAQVLRQSAVGLLVLLPLVAIAVGLFIKSHLLTQDSEYLESETFELAYGVESVVLKRKEDYKERYSTNLIFGVMIIIMAIIPVFVSELIFSELELTYITVPILLIIVSIGVNLVVKASIIQSGFDKILQEKEYSLQSKKENKLIEKIAAIYWPAIVAIYLYISFTSNGWERTWIIWPVAGVSFAVIAGIASIFTRD